jgi:hypothetical protein
MAKDKSGKSRMRRRMPWMLFALAFTVMGFGLWAQVQINRGDLALPIPAGLSAVDLGSRMAMVIALVGLALLVLKPARAARKAAPEGQAKAQSGAPGLSGKGPAAGRARAIMAARRMAQQSA